MSQTTNPQRVSPPWLLIAGLLLGGALLVLMVWDSISSKFRNDPSTSLHVVKLTDNNWQQEVTQSTVPVLVDCWGYGCPPCEQLAPIIEKVAEVYKGKIKVGKLNVNDNPKMAGRYQIQSIPTVMFFKGSDDPIAGFEGYRPEKDVVKAIEAVLAKK